MISIPVRLDLPFGGRSTFSVAIEAREKLLKHIRNILSLRGNNSISKLQQKGTWKTNK